MYSVQFIEIMRQYNDIFQSKNSIKYFSSNDNIHEHKRLESLAGNKQRKQNH